MRSVAVVRNIQCPCDRFTFVDHIPHHVCDACDLKQRSIGQLRDR